MLKNLYILFALFAISCGSNGIEGYVSEPITITAEQPDEGMDIDYFWTLTNQPDGSLMNSGDLVSTKNGNEMTFTPDYPGEYSIQVVISDYGDEISNQIFTFAILDYSEKKIDIEIEKSPEEENWLNEEIDDEEIDDEEIDDEEIDDEEIDDEEIDDEEIDDEEIDDEEIDDEEIDDEEIDDEEIDDEEIDDEEINNEEIDDEEIDDEEIDDEEINNETIKKTALNKKPISKNRRSLQKNIELLKKPSRESSIAARTDRFTIQITSKKMLKDAQLYSRDLIEKGYDAYIQKVVFKSNEVFYRVRVGSYDNYDSAKIAADALSEELSMSTWVDFVRKEQ
jgi:cell division septation protein DedD